MPVGTASAAAADAGGAAAATTDAPDSSLVAQASLARAALEASMNLRTTLNQQAEREELVAMAEKTMGKRPSPTWEEVLNQPQASPGSSSIPAGRAPAPKEQARVAPADPMKPWQGADEFNYGPPTLQALGEHGDGTRSNRRLSFRSEEDGNIFNLTRSGRRSSARRSSTDDIESVGERRRSQSSEAIMKEMEEIDEIERRRDRRSSRHNSLCESIAEVDEDDHSVESGSSNGDASVPDKKKRRQDEKLMRKIRRHKEIRSLIQTLWGTPLAHRQPIANDRSKITNKMWTKAEYADFHRSVCHLLTHLSGEEFDDKAAWETMLFDFDNDAAGKPHASVDDVTALLFEVAEMWLSNSTDATEYITFFVMLLEETTVIVDESRAGKTGSATLFAGKPVDLSATRAWLHTWPRTPRGGALMSPRD